MKQRVLGCREVAHDVDRGSYVICQGSSSSFISPVKRLPGLPNTTTLSAVDATFLMPRYSSIKYERIPIRSRVFSGNSILLTPAGKRIPC
jgi:hypothetical protein